MRTSNLLLDRLTDDRLRPVLDASERVKVRARDVLFSAYRRLGYGFFPLDCVVSLTVTLEQGALVECGTVGKEGMVAIGLLLEDDMCPFDASCQVPGELLRIPADPLREAIRRSAEFRRIVKRYTLGLAHQIARSGGCNRRHTVRQRLCRRLLTTHDRIVRSRIPVTQEILGEMLSARRADVNAAVSTLVRAGIVRSERGLIEILDRRALEDAACECYFAERREFDRLLR